LSWVDGTRCAFPSYGSLALRGGVGGVEGVADEVGLALDDGEVGEQGAVRGSAGLFQVAQAGRVDVVGGGEGWLAEAGAGADAADGLGGADARQFGLGQRRVFGVREGGGFAAGRR